MFKPVLLLLVLVCISWNVEGKAVNKKIKPTVYTGSSYSVVSHTNPQWLAQEHAYWYKSETGKNDYHPNAGNSKLDDYVGKSNPIHNFNTNYDVESYENLDQMFNSEPVPQVLQQMGNFKGKLHSNKYDDPLENDQVFLHHEADKKSKPKDHKVAPNLPKSYPTVHSKSNMQSTASSTRLTHQKIKTHQHKSNFQSLVTTTQLPTVLQEFETEHLSEKPSFNSNEFVSISSEHSLDLSESLELSQRNLPVQNESEVLKHSESEEIKMEETRTQTTMTDNFASSVQANKLSDKDNFNSVMNTEDKNLFKMGIDNMFEAGFDSFVFNPNAQPLEKFQDCKTPQNESGSCRYVQHCMLPGILNSIQHFMENVCIIEGRFIGVCCPEFPVQTVRVKWEDQPEQFDDRNDPVEIPQDCGIGTNTRVVGGTDADRKAWLWMVALLNDKKKFFCGGSLINNRYVLTAAHCTFGNSKNQIVARLGEYDFNDPREPHDDYKVVEIKRHGQYSSRTLKNDIALLKLEKPVVFNEFVQTICFPESVKDYIGDVATLVGWGHLNGASGGTSDVLQEANFPVISNDQCSSIHRVPMPSSLICAAAVKSDKGACNGDSGGPLMLLDENNRWKVIGIVSWGRKGCSPEFPTVYTRVTHYMDWIRKHST